MDHEWETRQATLREAEIQHAMLLNLCSIISLADSAEAFVSGTGSALKDFFGFERLLIGYTDAAETQLNSLVAYPPAKVFPKAPYLLAGDEWVRLVLQSPEALNFDLSTTIKENAHGFLNLLVQSGIREVVALGIPLAVNCSAVLLLCYSRKGAFDTAKSRMLKRLGKQFSITITNMLLRQHLSKAASVGWQKIDVEPNEAPKVADGQDLLLGHSAALQHIRSLVAQVATAKTTVMLTGESGTGKGVVAKCIHSLSGVRSGKMIAVNCAAIPEHLMESELFGHEKGSFTGATDRRIGKFEMAHNGTLFLDEIGDLSLEMQAKLLRALQEKEIERIGGRSTIKVNVRIISATSKNLQAEVLKGAFRSDLYYRLNVFPIVLPPLRDRKEDILPLAQYFLQQSASRLGKKITGYSSDATKSLTDYDWPGNIRELENLVERSAVLAQEPVIRQVAFADVGTHPVAEETFQIKTLQEFEREYILEILKKSQWRVSGPYGAAKKLGLPPTTLISKMKKLDIRKSIHY